MIQRIEMLRQRVNDLEIFCTPYAEFFNASDTYWYANGETNDIHFWCASCQGGKDLLDAVGQLFGKSGWTARPCSKTYIWVKTVGDFTLHCHDAADVPQEQERPVMMAEWPVLLEDTRLIDPDLEAEASEKDANNDF